MRFSPKELRKKYLAGDNISALLRSELGVDQNTQEIIEISYDMQSGSYIRSMGNPDTAHFMQRYAANIAKEILALCAPDSVLEAGVGEATTLSGVLSNLAAQTQGFGFDLSWSRVAYANQWLQKQNIKNATLCTGDLLNIPFLDNSIDVVYTSHSIEPNGGQEEPILKELYRVARRYLILFEPGYELADDQARARMDQHGYCKNLAGISEVHGYKVLKHELLPQSINPLNPTSLIVIEKCANNKPGENVFACPRYKTPLQTLQNAYFSDEALVAYPVLGGIPCLRIENGVFASHFNEILFD